MAGRIRTLKPEVLEDEKTASLSHEAFRLFVGVILLADDYGNLRANPRWLHGQVFWASTCATIQGAIAELVRAGVVTTYQVHGQEYLHIKNWEKHQKVNHVGSPRVPLPIAHCGTDSRESLELSREPLETSRESLEGSRESQESLLPDLRSPISDLRSPTREPIPGEGVQRGSEGHDAPDATESRRAPAAEPTTETAVQSQAVQETIQSAFGVKDESLPIQELKASGKGNSAQAKTKREPKPDLTPELLSDCERNVLETIEGDESLKPIVQRPCKLAKDLVAVGPGLNVANEVLSAGAWLRANPSRAKSNGNSFLLGWVKRSQERRGGRAPLFQNSYPVQHSGQAGHLDEAVRRDQENRRKANEEAERNGTVIDDSWMGE